MYPNLYNIPGMQNMPWMNNIPGMNQIKSKWSEINPFRTVESAGQFGSGLNASAGQLYDHFNRKVALDRKAGNEGAKVSDYGFTPANRPQSIADFLERRNPKPIAPPKLPGNIPGNLPGLPPNFQLPPNIFNAGQGMFPGIDFSQIQKQGQGIQSAAPMPAPVQQGPAPQQPMTNPQMPQAPQVPQFDASIFNMQPQMMINRPRPGGI